MTSLTDINGIGPALAKRLEAAGIVDCSALAAADPAALTSIPGVTETRLAAWQKAIAEMGITVPSGLPATAATPSETPMAEGDAKTPVVVALPTAALPEVEATDGADTPVPKKTKAEKTKAKDEPKAKKKKDGSKSKAAKDSDKTASKSKASDKKKTKKKKSSANDKPTKTKKKADKKKKSDAKAKSTKAKAKKKKAKAA
ncbi:helix-hairpin-helix domain-containing protein [Marivita sp.]|uniref:helix-hairpin-helix domain-containing protein n=1 Tax=Marivita sp. TaxID=2003365 RepID=UPI0026060BF4|nr:helix-hairpin-helix domain-containing protein [Marivita sp.]